MAKYQLFTLLFICLLPFFCYSHDCNIFENKTFCELATVAKSGIRVLVYSDLDSVSSFSGNRSLMDGLAKEFGFVTTKPYGVWSVGGELAGWSTEYQNILTFVAFKGAAHSQSETKFQLLKAFLAGTNQES